MKTIIKRAIRDEKGNVLILVLIVLVVGGLVLTPLLGLMSTGLLSGQVYERKMDEYYAADTGVEDAIWKIQNEKAGFDQDGYYYYPDPEQGVAELWLINEKSVEVEIHKEDLDPTCNTEYRYQILSTATSSDGSATTIHAVLKSISLNYSDLAGNAITSGGDVNIMPAGTNLSRIQGDISLPPNGVLKPEFWEEDGYEGGEVRRETLIWPELVDLKEFYWQDVEYGTHYDGDTEIDLEGNSCPPGPLYINGEAVSCPSGLGPIYIEGGLEIDNSANPAATLTLDGTLYITGDTIIEPSHDLTIDLNGHTIFVESSTTKPPEAKEALYIKGKCGIRGPGAIIAVGDIYFEPNIEAGETEPVLIYSVQGTTRTQPGGEFYGSILGYAGVELQPNSTIIYPEGGFGELNFPGLIEGKEGYSIESWEIK